MSLSTVPSSERLHIGIFGRRNAGKSSLINALTDQNISIVSDTAGTTTDPVSKAMEIPPIGPVVIIDTPGIDDCGELGKLRVKKAYNALNKTDIALLVVDGTEGMNAYDNRLLKKIQEKNVPYIIVRNKADLDAFPAKNEQAISISAKYKKNIDLLKDRIIKAASSASTTQKLISDKLQPGDTAVMVIPIDSSAPKGRIILPQQQVLRDILDANAKAFICRETELYETLSSLSQKPKIVICDSQVFGKVSAIVPSDVFLTSFSILLSRYKGDLKKQVEGAYILDTLKDKDKILIAEACTHHRQCNDIGTVKLPNWIKQYTNADILFDFARGGDFPDNLSDYKLIVHCGGCMLGSREMKYRIGLAEDNRVPITNYGTAIAHMNAILKRSIEIFADII